MKCFKLFNSYITSQVYGTCKNELLADYKYANTSSREYSRSFVILLYINNLSYIY